MSLSENRVPKNLIKFVITFPIKWLIGVYPMYTDRPRSMCNSQRSDLLGPQKDVRYADVLTKDPEKNCCS